MRAGTALAGGANAKSWETNDLDEHIALIKRQVVRSLDDMETIQLARKIVSGKADGRARDDDGVVRPYIEAWGEAFVLPPGRCPMRDAECEIVALWNFWNANVRYVYDPTEYDMFATVKFTLLAGAGDCFPRGTLLLRDDYALVPIEHVRAGDRIWGAQEWTQVEAVTAKGELPITALRLNNGSTLRLTEDHKLYVVECPRHRATASPCSCPTDQCRVERIRVSDVRPGMRLLQPERVAFGADDGDPSKHYVEGLFASDGWAEASGQRFSIAGKDGHPKEAQKREVEAICKALGISTRWHERYIAVNNREWAERLLLSGSGAPNKRLLSLNLGEMQAAALLRGVMADSGANTNGAGRTFTTTSRELAVQVRVLQRMFGRSCGSAFIENHGGLGTHPIYRMNVRGGHATTGTQKVLRVKEVIRDLPSEHTYDIQTYDHKVYLPEHDVTVSNCDDSTVGIAALAKAVGFEKVIARVVSVSGETWEHIYPLIGLPKEGRGPIRWVPLDCTVPGAAPGWEYEGVKAHQDFYL